MKAQAKYQKLQQDAVTKFRARFHAQTDFTKDRKYLRDHGAVTDAFRPEASTKLVADVVNATKKLANLQYEHAKVPTNVQLATSAKRLLLEMPVFSFDEDQRFIASSRILRAAIHFKLQPSSIPSIERSIDVYVKHTYMFDAKVAASFVSYIGALNPENIKEILNAAAPRLMELASDFIVSEGAAVLSTFARAGVKHEALGEAISGNVVNYALEAATSELTRAAVAIVRIGGAHVKSTMQALTPVFAERVGEMNVKDLVQLGRAYGKHGSCDRKLSNSVALQTLRHFTELNAMDVGEMMHAFHLFGQKNEPFIRRCAMRQLRQLDTMNYIAASMTLSALAHFRLKEHEVFSILGDKILELMQKEPPGAFHCATILHSYAKSREGQGKNELFWGLLKKFASQVAEKPSSVSTFSITSVLWSIGMLQLHLDPATHRAINRVSVAAASYHASAIMGDGVWCDMVNDTIRRVKASSGAKAVELVGPIEEALASVK